MVSGATLLGLLIVVVIILFFFGSAVSATIDTVNDAFEFSKLYFDASKLKIQPNSGEQICDLKVTVYGTLVNAIRPSIKLDPNNAKKYEWFNCSPATSASVLSLWDLGLNDPVVQTPGREILHLDPQDFLFLKEESIHAQIVLKSGAYKVDAVTQSSLKKELKIPAGILPDNYDMRVVYVVTNIPDRDYDLEIYYGRIINDLGPGVPFLDKVCKSTKTSC